MSRILIAGVGNIFLGDDGFGVEVVRRMSAEAIPAGVRVADFGIRGLHLAYELLDGAYDTTILVDALARGGPPGTIYVLEPSLDTPVAEGHPDAHSMDPQAVFATLKALGGAAGRVLIVGCEPASLEEGIGLSPAVEAAIDEAVRTVREWMERESGKESTHVPGDSRPDRATAPG